MKPLIIRIPAETLMDCATADGIEILIREVEGHILVDQRPPLSESTWLPLVQATAEVREH